jgi:GxxExxY protein
MMADLIYKEEVFAIIGAAMEVHRHLRSGFAEAVYQEAMEYELQTRCIAFERQKPLAVMYKQMLLKKTYVADLVCHNQIIVELKSQTAITKLDIAQTLNYLRITGLKLALIINFGDPANLEWQRLIY